MLYRIIQELRNAAMWARKDARPVDADLFDLAANELEVFTALDKDTLKAARHKYCKENYHD